MACRLIRVQSLNAIANSSTQLLPPRMLVCPAFRKEFNQEQKRKEKEKRQRIINREKKRAVKRIHLKKGLQAFLAKLHRSLYILQNRHMLPTSNNPLCLRTRHTISYIRLKEHLTFCILLSKTIRSFSASQKNLSLSSVDSIKERGRAELLENVVTEELLREVKEGKFR